MHTMNTKGVTLVELIVYIVLFAFITLLIGRQFNALVKNFAGGKRIVRQQTDMRDILGIMVREIRNTGLKVYIDKSGGTFTKMTADKIVVHPVNDPSSFIHGQSASGTFGDSLTIKKLVLDNDGAYKTRDTAITYYLDGTTLRRDLKTTDGMIKNTNSVIAENVYALQFEYGILACDDLLFDQDPPTGNWWNFVGSPSNVSKSGMTLTFTGSSTGSLKYDYSGFNGYEVKKNRNYRISLQIEPTGGFPGNLSYCAITFKEGTTTLGSERFLPRVGARDIIVPVHTDGRIKPYLEFSATGAGSFEIKGIEARCSELETYNWSFDPAKADKQFVRAIRVHVLTRTKEKTSTATSDPITVGDVTVPRSGAYTWRLYSETIEIPNNGVL